MPKTRAVQGVGDVDFPDGMSDEEITKRIETDILPHVKAAPAQSSGAFSGASADSSASAPAPKAHPVLDVADYVAAGLQGIGGLIPDITGGGALNPATQAQETENAIRTAVGYIVKHPGNAGYRQAIVSAIPIVGGPAAALADPSISYNEGLAPTHEQNVAAVGGGVALAALIAAPKVGSKMGKALARIRAVEPIAEAAPATAPPFTPEEIALADQAGQAQAGAEPRVSDHASMTTQMDAAGKRIEAARTIKAFPDEPTVEASKEPPAARTPEAIFRDMQQAETDLKTATDQHLADRAKADDMMKGLEVTQNGQRPRNAVVEEGKTLEFVSPKEASARYNAAIEDSQQRVIEARARRDGLYKEMDGAVQAEADAKTMHMDAGGIPLDWPGPKTVFDPKTGLLEIADSEFGAALRTLHTGERDVRIADANNLSIDIKKTLPDHVDREALTLARDFRSNPARLEALANGTDPVYDGMSGKVKDGVLENMNKLRPVIDRAMNPTAAMKAVDAQLTDYFGKALQEGKDLGFLGSNIKPDEYVNHLLLPADAASGEGPKIGPSGVNRYTPFAKKRFYSTVLDAVVAGAKIRTLDVADALSIYGDKHGTAAATHILIDTLKKGDIGKFATDSTAPQGWKEVGPGTRLFRNEVPYNDTEGNAQVAHQALYAPEKIAKALRPLTDPDYSSTIPGFTATKVYQQYIKSVELGLSVFHIRALNLSALGNEGLSGLIKSYKADMTSPEFRAVESTLLKAGGTTSITGRTFEAYRAARETSLPTRIDVIRNLPVFKQFDRVSAATSHLTFDVMQRKFKVTDFGIKDAAWIAEHPDATPPELAKARRAIAAEVNAVYGGLNWEALGVNKLTRSAARAFFLAPDWTFSNWQNAKTAFTTGPGGNAARAFWLRSAVVGVGLTQLTSLLLSGKKSDDPTQVYLGQDHHGNDIYQNLYFAGAPSDMIGLVKNVQDYGAVQGLSHSVAAKLAPITRTGVQVLSNRNWMGQEIAKKGSGETGDVRTGAHIASQLLPVPFSATNLVQMEASNILSGRHPSPDQVKRIAKLLGDPTKDYTPTEFLTTFAGGTKPRHIPHWKIVRAQKQGGFPDAAQEGQDNFPVAENHDLFVKTNPQDRLPARFVHARTALRGSPIRPGATDPPANEYTPDNATQFESGNPSAPQTMGTRWQGLYGRPFDAKSRDLQTEDANTILLSRRAGGSWPEVMAHEEGHAAWNDITPAEKAQWEKIHHRVASYGDPLPGETGVVQASVAKFHDDPSHSFAEMFGQYQLNPTAVKSEDAGAYGYFKKLFGGREYLPTKKK